MHSAIIARMREARMDEDKREAICAVWEQWYTTVTRPHYGNVTMHDMFPDVCEAPVLNKAAETLCEDREHGHDRMSALAHIICASQLADLTPNPIFPCELRSVLATDLVPLKHRVKVVSTHLNIRIRANNLIRSVVRRVMSCVYHDGLDARYSTSWMPMSDLFVGIAIGFYKKNKGDPVSVALCTVIACVKYVRDAYSGQYEDDNMPSDEMELARMRITRTDPMCVYSAWKDLVKETKEEVERMAQDIFVHVVTKHSKVTPAASNNNDMLPKVDPPANNSSSIHGELKMIRPTEDMLCRYPKREKPPCHESERCWWKQDAVKQDTEEGKKEEVEEDGAGEEPEEEPESSDCGDMDIVSSTRRKRRSTKGAVMDRIRKRMKRHKVAKKH